MVNSCQIKLKYAKINDILMIDSILATNRKVDLFCRKTKLKTQMTHQQKAVQDQIKAEIFFGTLESPLWLEIGDNLLKSDLS